MWEIGDREKSLSAKKESKVNLILLLLYLKKNDSIRYMKKKPFN